MGDIADYYGAYIPSYDEDLSELEDNELVALTSKSPEGIIQGIRKYYEEKGKLSDKQRSCLIRFIRSN
jgi:hypothetical protein